ncbi:MAG: glycosyltransferase family 2 protein [Henriciella sp.]
MKPEKHMMTDALSSGSNIPDSDIDISIIMAAFNAERYIEHAVASCLNMTGLSFEVIIVDDGSIRPLAPLIDRLTHGDPRVTVLSCQQNHGPAHARNLALQIAKGEFIAIVDSDDYVSPDRMQILIAYGRQNNADIIVDNPIEFFDSPTGRQEHVFLTGFASTQNRTINLTEFMRSGVKFGHKQCFGYLKPVIRRSTLEAGRHTYRTSLRISEDYFLIADMLRAGARMHYVAQSGYYYRKHAGSLTHRAQPAFIKNIALSETEFRNSGHPPLTSEQKRFSRRRSRIYFQMYRFEKIAYDVKHRRYLDAFWRVIKRPPDIPFQVFRGFFLVLKKALNSLRRPADKVFVAD